MLNFVFAGNCAVGTSIDGRNPIPPFLARCGTHRGGDSERVGDFRDGHLFGFAAIRLPCCTLQRRSGRQDEI